VSTDHEPAPIRPELIEAYRGIAPATLGHMPGVRVMASAIKPGYRNCKLVGPAFTVRAVGLDVSATNEACERIQAGQIMVVDRGADYEHACIGEFRALAQQQKGVAGWVVDGASTDILELEAMRFPVFARTWSALVGRAAGGVGDIDVPIACGGVVVYPGDLIVADDNGVVVLSAQQADALLPHCQEVERREAEQRLVYQRR